MNISIAICTYNGARFVEEQILSILKQDLPVSEIVVCDDGSKDDTMTIVKNISYQYPEIKWNIQQNSSNIGVVKNFEKAIRLCTGDIIFLSDQDDIWYHNKTKVMVDYFVSHDDTNILFTDADLVNENGQPFCKYTLFDAIYLKPYMSLWDNGLIFEILNVWNVVTGATLAFRKCIVDEFLPFIDGDRKLLHDNQIALAGCKTNSIALIKDRLIGYRQHCNNVIGTRNQAWIYNGTKCPNLLAMIVEPFRIKECLKKRKSERISFYEFRYHNYSSIIGKLKLTLSIFKYIKFYRDYWGIFYASDILYGVSNKLRERLINKN